MNWQRQQAEISQQSSHIMKRSFSSLTYNSLRRSQQRQQQSRQRRRCQQQQQQEHDHRGRFLDGSRFLSSDVKKELTDKEQKENARWAMGFFGVIIFANFFTVWQEWDALTGSTTSVPTKISNGSEEIDLVTDDSKAPLPKYSYWLFVNYGLEGVWQWMN